MSWLGPPPECNHSILDTYYYDTTNNNNNNNTTAPTSTKSTAPVHRRHRHRQPLVAPSAAASAVDYNSELDDAPPRLYDALMQQHWQDMMMDRSNVPSRCRGGEVQHQQLEQQQASVGGLSRSEIDRIVGIAAIPTHGYAERDDHQHHHHQTPRTSKVLFNPRTDTALRLGYFQNAATGVGRGGSFGRASRAACSEAPWSQRREHDAASTPGPGSYTPVYVAEHRPRPSVKK
eukprot:PhM_4_TR5650/c0_g1_i1/m.11660